MKKLTIKKSFFGSLLLVIVTSCSQSSIFKSPATKIQGKWKIEKVSFRPFNSLVNTDVSSQYSGQSVEFNSDNSLTKYTLSDTLRGTWNIQQNVYSESSYCENLITAVTNSDGTVTISTLTNLNIGTKKIKAYEYRGDGTYYYVFEKW